MKGGGRSVPVVSGAATRAEAETASGTDVWLVLVRHGPRKDLRTNWWSQPVYTVQLPSDLGRFRLKDEDNEFSVMFELKGRWYPLIGVWRHTRRMNLDVAENRAYSVVTFGRQILRKMGAKPWKARK